MIKTSTAGHGLARVVGSTVVALSALAQEYGSGINFVMPHSLQRYPGAQGLVPLAMLVAGLVLIPQVVLFVRYSSVMPRAGSVYVWLTRGLGPYAGFAIAFVWFVGICGAIGFLAYAAGTFVGDALQAGGLSGHWFTTRTGHLISGLVAIWLLTGLHASGIKHYGYLLYAAGALIIVAASIVIVTGFATSPATAMIHLTAATGIHPLPAVSHPSMSSFMSVVALFMFAYGGLTAATSLGGEVANPRKNMPRGLIVGWAAALILYSLIAYALFHAVPWWSALPIVESGHANLLTTPALIGMLAPRVIAIFLNALVAAIVIKTIAPQLLDASRFLFAWAEDGFVPKALVATNKAHAPALALLVAATLGSLFLADAVFGGWQLGVIVRASSIALTFAMLGLATLLLAGWRRWRRARDYAPACTRGIFVKVMAVCAVVIGLILVAFVIRDPTAAWYFQPWTQLLFTVILSLIIAALAHRRASVQSEDFGARFRTPPPQ